MRPLLARPKPQPALYRLGPRGGYRLWERPSDADRQSKKAQNPRMTPSFRLLAKRRFLPLFATQFLGAFNDNLFRTAMIMLVIYRIYNDPAQEAVFSAIAGG